MKNSVKGTPSAVYEVVAELDAGHTALSIDPSVVTKLP
jgi:hypothetical protein